MDTHRLHLAPTAGGYAVADASGSVVLPGPYASWDDAQADVEAYRQRQSLAALRGGPEGGMSVHTLPRE